MSKRITPHITRVPNAAVEALRLCVVVFGASVGYELARRLGGDGYVLRPFTATWIGIIVGSGLGYALGGILGRGTLGAVSRTERTLRDTSAEQLVAGSFGAVGGVLLGGGVSWPLFLVDRSNLVLPVFCFVLLSTGMLGYRTGIAKRESVLGIFGSRAGMAPRVVVAAGLPRVLDTSVAIDGRVVDVVRAGFLGGRMLIPSPVLGELQGLADASDDLRRSRGRRGLEVLEVLRREPGVEIEVVDDTVPGVPDVDAKLVRLCIDHQWALLTLDTNLARVAALAGVRVLNLHALALAVRPPVIAGDVVSVLLIKPGREAGQAVGYLDDGTMVVVEGARESVGSEAHVFVTSVLTTANGRMVFARPVGAGKPHDPRRVAAG